LGVSFFEASLSGASGRATGRLAGGVGVVGGVARATVVRSAGGFWAALAVGVWAGLAAGTACVFWGGAASAAAGPASTALGSGWPATTTPSAASAGSA
jgi:hypothetical protein